MAAAHKIRALRASTDGEGPTVAHRIHVDGTSRCFVIVRAAGLFPGDRYWPHDAQVRRRTGSGSELGPLTDDDGSASPIARCDLVSIGTTTSRAWHGSKVPCGVMAKSESRSSGETLRLEPLIAALDASRARYAVIGGVALSFYLEGHTPADLDVVFAPGRWSGRRAHAALSELIRRCSAGETEFVPPPGALGRGREVRLHTGAGVVDVVGTSLPIGVSRRGVVRRAARQSVEGVCLPLCSLNDLLRIKSGTQREGDLAHVEALRRLTI